MDTKIDNLTPEELAAEKAALEEVKEDEIRAKIVSDYGFDETDDAEKIEKLVASEVKHNKDLSTAIGQKIKYRELAKVAEKKPDPPPKDTSKQLDPEELEKRLDAKVSERLEQRDLEALGYPDELREKIRKVAKAQGISVKQAVADPYIQFQIGEYDKQKKADEAAAQKTNRGGGQTKKSWSLANPPNSDMTTEEGRKEWDEYLAEMKRQGN